MGSPMDDAPGKRRRGRPKTFDREHTLDVAVDGYWREGVDSLSLNEVCRRAEISKPGLYREFGGEDQFLDAVLTRYCETVLGPRMAAYDEDKPFRETLESIIAFATRGPVSDMPAGCLFAKMKAARGQLGTVTGAHVDDLRAQLIATYTEWLERSAQRGEITLPASLETTASYVDTQMTLMLDRMAAGEEPETVRAHAHLAFSILTESG